MKEFTAVPTEELENWQEARELEVLNARTQATRDTKARQERIAEMQRPAWMAFIWAAGCSALVILAHTGAMAGWLMQVGTTALSLAFGIAIGKIVK